MAAAFVGADSAHPTAVEALDVTVLRAEWAIESERGGPPLESRIPMRPSRPISPGHRGCERHPPFRRRGRRGPPSQCPSGTLPLCLTWLSSEQ